LIESHRGLHNDKACHFGLLGQAFGLERQCLGPEMGRFVTELVGRVQGVEITTVKAAICEVINHNLQLSFCI
jgi:hypothetical protein